MIYKTSFFCIVDKMFSKCEEGVSDLRIETEHALILANKEIKTMKLENERLKNEFSIVQSTVSDVHSSFGSLKNTVTDNSKVLAVLKTEKEISKMEKDFSSVKMASIENEIEESKIVLNHIKNTQNLSKIEQNDRVTNLEYELSKMRSRQINLSPVTVPENHEMRRRDEIGTDEKGELLSKISMLEKDYGSVTSNLGKLEVRVSRLEPLESKVRVPLRQHPMMCCTIMCYAMVYCTVLLCTAILHCIMLFYAVLCVVLYCTVLHSPYFHFFLLLFYCTVSNVS